MDSFIQAVTQIESSEPNLSPLALVRSLRRSAFCDDEMTIYFLGASWNLSDAVVLINASSISFFHKAIHHMVTDAGEERGVILTPDGTTVALAPLLLGIESGPKARAEGTPAVGLFVLTLGRILGLFQHPKVFRLAQPATLATDALINGVILGSRLSNLSASEQPPALSEIFKGYYVTLCQSVSSKQCPGLFTSDVYNSYLPDPAIAHSGWVDPCEFPKCGNLDCIISGSGGLRSRSPLMIL
uniref:Uncharacterized protein n=1 Tax=Gouania willdenowi TaxID=441366 RepID=A0A8C5N7L4_GOUWI